MDKLVNFYQNVFDENETTLENCFNLTSSKYCSSLDEVGWSGYSPDDSYAIVIMTNITITSQRLVSSNAEEQLFCHGSLAVNRDKNYSSRKLNNKSPLCPYTCTLT